MAQPPHRLLLSASRLCCCRHDDSSERPALVRGSSWRRTTIISIRPDRHPLSCCRSTYLPDDDTLYFFLFADDVMMPFIMACFGDASRLSKQKGKGNEPLGHPVRPPKTSASTPRRIIATCRRPEDRRPSRSSTRRRLVQANVD